MPGETTVSLHVDDRGYLVDEPVAGSEVLVDGGWIVPGLVDAHCHVGLGPAGPVDLEEADAQARVDREIIRAGRHLARPKRYIPGLAVETDEVELLPDLVAEQAAAGDGWVKLVGDWIDRGAGDLAPLWPDDVLRAAIDAAHAAGARVTAHVFGTDALPGLIDAGIDCIEHGTGLTDDLIARMAERGTALVPTLINVETFPGIADSAAKYPVYADHMRALHAGAHDVVRRATEAGVPVYAGTDAGGGIAHGRIADEIRALAAAGHPAPLGAASWAARSWLGRPAPHPGVLADLVVYRSDPRTDLAVLDHPALILLRGRLVAA
ncbi:MAG: amidohydrolase family protein [Pseudonocardiales bacterium]|nr:amidohydrolase family protein [Pseudonocardiales bacterium]